MMEYEKKYPIINIEETGKHISMLCMKQGYDTKELSKKMNVSRQAIYKWFNGQCLPDLDNLLILSVLLDVTIEDLLVYKENGYNYVGEGKLEYRASVIYS